MLKKIHFIVSRYPIFFVFFLGLLFSLPAAAVVEVNQSIPDEAEVKKERVKVIFSILSLIALQLSNGNDLPALQYMNFMDAVYVASYLFMIALMAEITLTSRLVENGNDFQTRRAQRIDRWFCLAYVSLFLLVNAWMLLYVFV